MRSTDEERRDRVAKAARRHGFSPDAAEAMLAALARGLGRQAQFDHPEFGGMGQWSGGMLMVGDMSGTGLKARVQGLIRDLSGLAGPAAPALAPAPKARPGPAVAEGSIPAMIEQLHALLTRGILTQAEFDAKKAELLARL